MRYQIINDRLHIGGEPVEYVPTAHVGGRIEPTLIVLHDTAGGPPGDSVGWLKKNPKEVSAHVIVKSDGKIVQMAPFDRRTNHAGPSTWKGRSGCNGWSIGIEIVNPGELRSDGYSGSTKRTYSGFVAHPATPWHKAMCWLPYTEAQLVAVEGLIAALAAAYPTISEVVGHHHVSPGRKVDPTPLMPWERMRAALRQVAAGRPTLAMQDKGTIEKAQGDLIKLGYEPGEVDGRIGARTEGAVWLFQRLNGLPQTGKLDDATLARIESPDAKAMITGTRDEATATSLAAAGSTTVKASNKAEIGVAASTALTTGNALTDAAQALAEADKAVKVVEGGRTLGSRLGDLMVWAMTPRGGILIATTLLSIGAWLLIRHIRNRRVAAYQSGRQA